MVTDVSASIVEYTKLLTSFAAIKYIDLLKNVENLKEKKMGG